MYKQKVVPMASKTVQLMEQRSIGIFADFEGPHSLPARSIDTSIYKKTKADRSELNRLKSGVTPMGFYCSNKLN